MKYFLFIFLFISITSFASDKKTLILGDGEIAPWAFFEDPADRKQTAGIVHDIGVELSKEINTAISTSILPYARLFDWFKNGKVDLNISIDNPSVFGSYTEIDTPVSSIKFHLYSHVGSPIFAKDLKDGLTIGVLRGSESMYKPWLGKSKANLKFKSYSSFEKLIELVYKKRLRGAIVTKVSFDFVSKEQDYKKSNFAKPIYLFENNWNMKVSKKSKYHTPKLIKEINNAVKKMRNEGVFERIISKHST